MKKFFILGLLALFSLSLNAQVLLQPYSAVSVGTTNGASTLSWVIAPCYSANGGVPIVTYLNATSDKASSVVQFYKVTASTVANNTNTTTSVPVVTTNGFDTGLSVIVRHVANDVYEKLAITQSTGGTNLTLTAGPAGSIAIGDIIYSISKTGVSKIPVGNATVALTGNIYAGQRNAPIYAEVDSTTSGTLNAMAVQFVP